MGRRKSKRFFGGFFFKRDLSLVVKSPSKLSKKSIQSPDSFAEYYKEQEKDKEDYEKRISDFISSDTVSLTGILGDMADYGMDEFCLDEYIQHKFLAYGEKTDAKWKQALDYGLEYLAAGKASDEENLESVLNRILLIRTVTNFVALESDSKRRGEARAAAIAAVGFTRACSVNYIDADVNSYYVEYIGKLNGCCGSFGWKRCATLENAEKVCNKFYGNCFDES